jgi:ubiquitin carboxyl-terminal hydrolase 36/42
VSSRAFTHKDAHEFLLNILDKVDDKRTHPDHKSIVQRIFEGEFRQSSTGDMRGHASHTDQPFQDLSFEVRPSVLSAIAHSVRTETLSEDNTYKCEQCGGRSRAKKQVTIHAAPPILAVHLKRFSSGLEKNESLVDYPALLDLNPYSISDGAQNLGKYRLIATVNHAGNEMFAGHYIAKCMSSLGSWHEFNDSHVLCPK